MHVVGDVLVLGITDFETKIMAAIGVDMRSGNQLWNIRMKTEWIFKHPVNMVPSKESLLSSETASIAKVMHWLSCPTNLRSSLLTQVLSQPLSPLHSSLIFPTQRLKMPPRILPTQRIYLMKVAQRIHLLKVTYRIHLRMKEILVKACFDIIEVLKVLSGCQFYKNWSNNIVGGGFFFDYTLQPALCDGSNAYAVGITCGTNTQ